MLSLPLWGQTVLPEAVHFLTNSEHLFIHPSAWNRYSAKFAKINVSNATKFIGNSSPLLIICGKQASSL